MPALNFVAVEDGLEEWPEVLGLVGDLRVKRALAVYYVVRLRKLVIQQGHHITGQLPKRIKDGSIAAFLDFEGPPKKLIRALKTQGLLSARRGRGYCYPNWKETITGQYAARREEDRAWHEKKRREERERQSAEVARLSEDASADGRATSSDIQTERKKERDPAGPPVRPPGGGQAQGASRWAWLMENAPTPQNREVCIRYLDAMSAEDWALVQWAYTARKRGGPSISQKSLRTLGWATDVFLRKTAYLRFARLKVAAESAANAPAKAGEKPAGGKRGQPAVTDLQAQKKAAATKFILELVADPDLPKAEKERRKAEHEKTWGERPWEKGGAK